VVDDGSTDRTAEIVSEFSSRGDVLLIRQENTGQGPARNRGTREARGEFLWFVDADDYLPDDAFAGFGESEAKRACVGQDIVMFSYMVRTGKEPPRPMPDFHVRLLASRPADTFSVRDFPAVLASACAPWNKWFRRSFLEEHGILFPKNLIEDFFFHQAAFSLARSVRYADRPIYVYRQTLSFLSRKSGAERLEVFDCFTLCESFFGKINASGRMKTAYNVTKLNQLGQLRAQIDESLKKRVDDYAGDCVRSMGCAEIVRVFASPLLSGYAKHRIAETKSVDEALLGRVSGFLGRFLR
jgi:CDP-glycerol glycerophosphotransferase